MKSLLSNTKKYHNRKRILHFFMRRFKVLAMIQKWKNNIFKKYFLKKTYLEKNNFNSKQLFCYQQKTDFSPMYVDLPSVI